MKFIFRAQTIFCFTLIVFVALLFILPSRGFISSDLGGTILTVTTFLFGIIAGFYIAVTAGDYNKVKDTLAQETSSLMALYQNVLIYDSASAQKLRDLIDDYVRRAFDYELMDYTENTVIEFERIKELIRNLPVKNELSSVHQQILGNVQDLINSRQQMIVLGTKTLSLFQWGVLYILAAFVILSLYGLRTGELFFDVVSVLVSSATVLILLLIRDLDLYIWNEKTFSFDIFEQTFLAIGQKPYYPQESLLKKRIQPNDPEYRVGILLNPGKNFERKIETVKK